jgi:hypothetical protein
LYDAGGLAGSYVLVYRGDMVRSALVVALCWASFASAGEQTVAKLTLPAEAGRPAIDVTVDRVASADGGVLVKLGARTNGRTQTLTLYQGGGDEDGAGDRDLRAIAATAFELPGGRPAVRVDVTYHPADQPKRNERTDTFLVGVAAAPRVLLELPTRLLRDRSKVCRELVETQLGDDGIDLVTRTVVRLEPALGDDDLPIDRTCVSPREQRRKIYKWAGERFIDPDAPAGASTSSKPAVDDDD